MHMDRPAGRHCARPRDFAGQLQEQKHTAKKLFDDGKAPQTATLIEMATKAFARLPT